MFAALLKKEIHLHILSFRFILCFALLLIFSLTTVIVRYEQASAFAESAAVQRKAGDAKIDYYIENAAMTPEKLRGRFSLVKAKPSVYQWEMRLPVRARVTVWVNSCLSTPTQS